MSIHNDFRQSEAWMQYLSGIGWKWHQFSTYFAAYRAIPGFGRSIFKIQRVKGQFDVDELEVYAKSKQVLSLLIEPHFESFDEGFYRKEDYFSSRTPYAPSATMFIDLTQSEEVLWKALSENARRNVKYAKKQGVMVRVYSYSECKPLFDQIYSQWKHVADSKHFYMPSYDEDKIKYSALEKLTHFGCAYNADGVLLASVWFVEFGQTITYLHAGNSAEGYEKKANFQLVWESIKIFKQRGLEILDFESYFDERYPRSTKKWRGFSEFKAKFGGSIVYYPQPQVKIYNPIFKVFYRIGDYFN